MGARRTNGSGGDAWRYLTGPTGQRPTNHERNRVEERDNRHPWSLYRIMEGKVDGKIRTRQEKEVGVVKKWLRARLVNCEHESLRNEEPEGPRKIELGKT